MKSILIILLSLFLIEISVGQRVTFSGYVSDSETGEHLIGAHIYEKTTGKGTISNEYGFYSLTISSMDSVLLICTYLGYRELQLFVSSNESKKPVNLKLQPGVELGEVTVTSPFQQERITPNTIILPVKLVTFLPSFGGEFDLMKALQLMPGVQSGNEGNSGLYVRGGGPDQNLVLLDDVPLYYVNHLAGFISTFNTDAINSIKLIKGGFPARYGGRLSSILDIRMKDGNMKEFMGSGSIGLLSTKLTLEGPIKKDTSSYIISGRRFMYDLITRPLTKLTDGNSVGYSFYDLNIKINHKFSDKDRIYLSLYSGNDGTIAIYKEPGSYTEKSKSNIRWGNSLGAFRWNHVYNQKLFSNLTLTYTRFRFITKLEQVQKIDDVIYDYTGKFYSSISDIGAKIDYSYFPLPDLSVNFGAGTVYHNFSPWKNSYSQVSGNTTLVDTTTGNKELYTWEYYLYLEGKLKFLNYFTATTGFHASQYNSQGKTYRRVDPRVSLIFNSGRNTSISASYSEMQQYVHLLSYSNVGIPIDLWMPSTNNVPPSLARQASVGYTRTLKNGKYDLSAEIYNKWMDNLIEYKPGISIIESTEDWQDLIEKGGKGRSYGFELMIRKNLGNTTGWIGYTLSKTTHQFDNLNNGNPYPYKFDRRHDISLVLMHKLSDNIDFSATWVYGTGNAFTLALGKYNTVIDDPQHLETEPPIQYFPAFIYGEKNNYRMRSYHRLDIGVNFRKDTRWGEGTWNISVYNLYNRKNPYYYFTDISWNTGKTVLKQQSLFPIMPSVSYSFKF